MLTRLGLPFTTTAPNVDETPLPGESAGVLAIRLAGLKADRIAQQVVGAASGRACIIIGCDQVACLGSEVLDKPGTVDEACQQLRRCSGRSVRFHTALCVRSAHDRELARDVTTVHFRQLGSAEIDRYVTADTPIGCAGGFKAEALGITLFERIESQDPTALIGLPLIALSGMLRRAGLPLP